MSYILDIHLFRENNECKVVKQSLIRSVVEEEKKIPFVFSDKHREEIQRELRELREKHDIQHARIILPFYMCLFNMVELPLTKRSDLENALIFELGSVLPLPVEEYVYDFSVLSRTRATSKILSLCVKKDIVNSISSIVKDADISVRSIRCGFMEELSAFYTKAKKKNFIFIHVESDDTNLAVIQDKVCIELKRVRNIDSLNTDIEKLKKLHDITDVYITGDITNEMRAAVDVSAVARQRFNREITFRPRPYFFELFRPEMMEGYKDRFLSYAMLVATLSLVLLFAGFIIPMYRDYSTLKNIKGEIREIKDMASDLIEKRKQLDTSREKLVFLEEREKRRSRPLKIIGEITNIVPKDAWIMSLHVDEKGFIELKGFAENASSLVEILEESGMFENVGFSAPILRSGDKTRFSIKMVLEQ